MVVPRRGQPRDLVKMAAENATETLQALRSQWQADTHKQEQALAELQSAMQLPTPPNRIECYDISHTQGVATVGSMVVFTQGVPDKKLYRRFNVEGSAGVPDDFASMEEVLTRRFKRWEATRDLDQLTAASLDSMQQPRAAPGSKPDESFAFLPDLLIVDGGKGQLSRAMEVLKKYELFDKVPVVGLAKQDEEIFFPNKPDSLLLPRHSQGLYLVQRIRDEAHRFAITAHRARRTKQGMASALDSLPGIGPVKRKALLNYFGSVDKIREASVVELSAVPGINKLLAENIKAHLE
jgi:excinuclease ABC subunit C